MDNKCEYKTKCNVSKVLIMAVISFITVCSIMLFILFSYHQKVNESFKNYIATTSEIISSIKIENQKGKQIIISDELSKAISRVNQNEYENFLRSYYESQNNWLNVWLTILALLMGFLGLITPLCFFKFYESKKEEFNIVIRDIEKKKETMTKDIEEAKKYVEKAKESERRVEVNRLLVSAMRESSQKNYTEALERIDKALELAPKNISVISAKAEILIRAKKYEEAVKSLTEAIKLSPLDYRYFCDRGVAFMGKGDLKRALQDFNNALSLIPAKSSPSVIMYNMIECYLRLKNFIKALQFLSDFIRNTKSPYIFDDDKPIWLNLLKDNLGQKEATEIANLINNTLRIRKRDE